MHGSLTTGKVFSNYWTILAENVGEYYGKGDDNVIAVGSGWELFVLFNGMPKSPDNEDSVVTYHLDITDEAKATMFMLKWA